MEGSSSSSCPPAHTSCGPIKLRSNPCVQRPLTLLSPRRYGSTALATSGDVSEHSRLGRRHLLLKNSQSSELLHAIRDALKGVPYVAPEIRRALNEVFVRDPKAVDRPQHLTDRQREVLQCSSKAAPYERLLASCKFPTGPWGFTKFGSWKNWEYQRMQSSLSML
jgi:hypothetical protein